VCLLEQTRPTVQHLHAESDRLALFQHRKTVRSSWAHTDLYGSKAQYHKPRIVTPRSEQCQNARWSVDGSYLAEKSSRDNKVTSSSPHLPTHLPTHLHANARTSIHSGAHTCTRTLTCTCANVHVHALAPAHKHTHKSMWFHANEFAKYCKSRLLLKRANGRRVHLATSNIVAIRQLNHATPTVSPSTTGIV
jgi:hypothetical protein